MPDFIHLKNYIAIHGIPPNAIGYGMWRGYESFLLSTNRYIQIYGETSYTSTFEYTENDFQYYSKDFSLLTNPSISIFSHLSMDCRTNDMLFKPTMPNIKINIDSVGDIELNNHKEQVIAI